MMSKAMTIKDIRRLLADTREEKMELEARNLKVDWSKTVYLLSSSLKQELQKYFEQTQDTFALRVDAQTNDLYLFDVRLMVDPIKQNETPDLALVLESCKKRS